MKLDIKQTEMRNFYSGRTHQVYQITEQKAYKTADEARFALRKYNRQIQVMSAMLVIFMLSTIVCLGLLVFAGKKEAEHTAVIQAIENRGCIASAYQATQNGFDLEENLTICK